MEKSLQRIHRGQKNAMYTTQKSIDNKAGSVNGWKDLLMAVGFRYIHFYFIFIYLIYTSTCLDLSQLPTEYHPACSSHRLTQKIDCPSAQQVFKLFWDYPQPAFMHSPRWLTTQKSPMISLLLFETWSLSSHPKVVPILKPLSRFH